MRFNHTDLALVAVAFAAAVHAPRASAGDIVKQIIAEIDPQAPIEAANDQATSKVGSSMWAGQVDFNLGGVVSTGPEFWTGTFAANGPASNTSPYLRQDLYPAESARFNAIRLRWNITWWEQNQSMRGWYLKAGYSYTNITSHTNLYYQVPGEGTTTPTINNSVTPAQNTALITDVRHGVYFGVGNRWIFADRFTVTVGTSVTTTFKRALTVDSTDPDSGTEYDRWINKELPDTRLTTRTAPECNLGLGYTF